MSLNPEKTKPLLDRRGSTSSNTNSVFSGISKGIKDQRRISLQDEIPFSKGPNSEMKKLMPSSTRGATVRPGFGNDS